MSPAAFTDREREKQKRKMMKACESLLFKHGIKKVNVADIIKEANISRGTFYKYFSNKDECIAITVFSLHLTHMEKIKNKFTVIDKRNFKESIKVTIKEIILEYELLSLFDNLDEINSLMNSLPIEDMEIHLKTEEQLIKNVLIDMGVDIKIVNPEIVHNLFYIISQVNTNQKHILGERMETIDVLIDTLAKYIISGMSI